MIKIFFLTTHKYMSDIWQMIQLWVCRRYADDKIQGWSIGRSKNLSRTILDHDELQVMVKDKMGFLAYNHFQIFLLIMDFYKCYHAFADQQ